MCPEKRPASLLCNRDARGYEIFGHFANTKRDTSRKINGEQTIERGAPLYFAATCMAKETELYIDIPKDIENLQLPSPELVTYYHNLNNRVLWLDSEVDNTWLEFIRYILKWNREDVLLPINQRKRIILMLFSYGGDLDTNNAFIDVIRASKTPIWAVNIGQACSAACFISIACHRRLAFPNATYLIHQGGGDGFSGTYEQVVAAVLEYQRKIESLQEYLVSNTKIPQDVLEERIRTEWFISAQEALEYGICDEIIQDIDSIL